MPELRLLNFYVRGEPKPQPRPRARVMKIRGKLRVHMYDQLEQYEKLPNGKRGPRKAWDAAKWRDRIIDRVRAEVAAAGIREPIDGPVRVDLDFNFTRPGYMLAGKYPSHRIEHTGKPDRDNLEKLLLDAITQAGWYEDSTTGETVKRALVWNDDNQVCQGEVQKWWCGRGDLAGVRIMVTQLCVPQQNRLELCEPKL